MKPSVLKILLKKEFLLMKRNALVPRVMVMLPILVMLVIPLVTNLDIKHASVVVVDFDRSILSRRISSDINGTDILHVVRYCETHDDALSLMEEGEADVIMTVPAYFSRDLETGKIRKYRFKRTV